MNANTNTNNPLTITNASEFAEELIKRYPTQDPERLNKIATRATDLYPFTLSKSWYALLLRYKKLHFILVDAFEWAKSAEGYTYWAEIHSELFVNDI